MGAGTRGGEGTSTVSSKKERSTPAPDRERDREHQQAPGSASSSAALSGRVGKSSRNGASASVTPRDAKSAQKLLFSLHDAISGHRNGNVFQGPVRKVSDESVVVADLMRGGWEEGKECCVDGCDRSRGRRRPKDQTCVCVRECPQGTDGTEG